MIFKIRKIRDIFLILKFSLQVKVKKGYLYMNFNFKFLCVLALCAVIFNSVSAKGLTSKIGKEQHQNITNILKAYKSDLDSINQLIIVVNNDSTEVNVATLITLEKEKKRWKIKYKPVKAYIGEKGFASQNSKMEGDKKSPTGLFALGRLFTYESAVNTKMPFLQVTAEDKWIDDPESPNYNTYVRGETNANSFEKLLLKGDYYKYCMVIEYNTNPIIKGKGSAIFFHLGNELSSGCVVIDEKEMIDILQWLTPQKNPHILMGNYRELTN